MLDELIWGDRLAPAGLTGQILATTLRYLHAIVRDFFSGQLTMRAMSLVYTTLLSIVPLLAFSFAILKGVGVFNELEPYLDNLLAPLGEQGKNITSQVLTLVDNVRGSVLGGIGLAFFLYTAISTVQKVEDSFNYTWYVTKSRNFARRFTEYLIVLLVGPLLMVTALGILTSIQSTTTVQWIINNAALGPLFVLGGKLVPYIMISGVFTFLYVFLPNTKVNFSSALIGGIAGGFMWATVSAVFAAFVIYATRIQQIYAGFAVTLMSLIWLYLNWLILLIGAQLAFYHQQPAFLRTGRQEPRLSNTVRERIALNIMFLVGRSFLIGSNGATIGKISAKLRIPTIAISPIIGALESAGLVKTTVNEDLLPGKEMSNIKLADILDVVRLQGETGSHQTPRWTANIDDLCNNLDTAIKSSIDNQSLLDLLEINKQTEK